ncbi:hypothetical protein [Dolichospermum circinale]|uniref:hypothetical protein n=1 Tax=Dolichospermum circinale TaxID=109265 RepID=UPI00232E63CD|nr:hypothetical protein [Dolichospermum circinale]MDB9464317.1 hypothetical protein [Dolichospermum circinale CS-541/04]MDB9547657.1 hypothetical protein [Dolichospermum circinale CS-1031]
MSIIVDTSVWSLALRRKTPSDSSPAVTILQNLITNDQVALLGARFVKKFFLESPILNSLPVCEITSELSLI